MSRVFSITSRTSEAMILSAATITMRPMVMDIAIFSSQSAEKSGMAGLQISKAEAQYDDGANKRVELEVTDTGGAGGLMGLAGWMNIQGEKENDGRIERTRREGGRMIHEEISKRDGDNEYTVVLGDRFIVSARGQGVSIDALRSSVGSLDLAKLESMKEVGATK